MEHLIEVELTDGTVRQVNSEALDSLLKHGQIVRFKRAEGWAIVGRSSLRDMRKTRGYSIPERRHFSLS